MDFLILNVPVSPLSFNHSIFQIHSKHLKLLYHFYAGYKSHKLLEDLALVKFLATKVTLP